MTPVDVVYLDANTFIYAAESPAAYPSVVRLFQKLARGECLAVTSALTIAEVLVMPLRLGNAGLVSMYQKQLATGGGLTVVPIDENILTRAAAIRAKSAPVRLPDAIHVATAISSNATAYVSNDQRLRSVANLRIVLPADLP